MQILIVEDDQPTAQCLQKALEENGFIATTADNGRDGLHLASSGYYDLILLDVLLPGMDGWTICRSLRKVGRQIPIFFLTALDSIEDRVKGLELGADDYLVKPFALAELLARIRSILRRGAHHRPETVKIADLEIDLLRHKVFRAGRQIDLTLKEFSLLLLLARRAGEALSRRLIAEQVWNMNFGVETNMVDVHIRRLRRKIDDPYPNRLIQTIRGVGYLLEERQDQDGGGAAEGL